MHIIFGKRKNVYVDVWIRVNIRAFRFVSPTPDIGFMICIWQCELGKWTFISRRYGTCYEGYMFPMLVEEQLDLWPEKNVRRRIWVCFWSMDFTFPRSLFCGWWFVLIYKYLQIYSADDGGRSQRSLSAWVDEGSLRQIGWTTHIPRATEGRRRSALLTLNCLVHRTVLDRSRT